MRYAWTAIAINFIWLILSLVVAFRPQANADFVMGVAAVGTGILAWIVFKPKL